MNRVLAAMVLCGVWVGAGGGVAAGQRPPAAADSGVAVVYYWKAKPGKLEEYSRYIREVAEPIDADGQRHGAFISVTTYISEKPDSPWTHMRIFILRDHAQAEALKPALDAAGTRVQPDPAKRKAAGDYAATLRDFVASEEVTILR